MKITLNLSKVHVYLILATIVVLAGAIWVIAAYDPINAAHQTLFTDRIEPMTGTDIDITAEGTSGTVRIDGSAVIVNGDLVNFSSLVESVQECVVFETENATSGVWYEIDLLKSGKNICAAPLGCEVVIFQRLDSTGQIKEIDGNSGYIIQGPEGYYVENLGTKSDDKNGEDSKHNIKNFDSNKCILADDKPDQFTPSPVTFVFYDGAGSRRCIVTLCSR
jgi:hypothetical protein